jgi:hypothetical protein
VVVAGVAGSVAAAVMLVTGVAGVRWGWLWTALALSSVAAPAFAGIVRRGRWTPHATAAVVAIATMAGLWVAHSAAYSHGRLRSALSDLDLGDDFRQIDATESGAPICHDACPALTVRYEVPRTASVTAQAIAATLRREGYEVEPWRSASMPFAERTLSGNRDRLRLSIWIVTRFRQHDHSVRYLPVSAGSTGVEMRLTSSRGS